MGNKKTKSPTRDDLRRAAKVLDDKIPFIPESVMDNDESESLLSMWLIDGKSVVVVTVPKGWEHEPENFGVIMASILQSVVGAYIHDYPGTNREMLEEKIFRRFLKEAHVSVDQERVRKAH
jgi:hypothetical protein